MDRKEKDEKRALISQFIDFANGRFRDRDIDQLYDLVQNRDQYNGLTKKKSTITDSSSSDGRFTRYEDSTYRIVCDDDIRIERHYEYRDSDDGQHGEYDYVYSTARDILTVLNEVFGKKKRR